MNIRSKGFRRGTGSETKFSRYLLFHALELTCDGLISCLNCRKGHYWWTDIIANWKSTFVCQYG